MVNSVDKSLVGSLIDEEIDDAGYAAACDLDRDGAIGSGDYDPVEAWESLGRGSPAAGRISEDLPEWKSGGFMPGPSNPIGYCGYTFAKESVLYAQRFRWYDPVSGRWLQRDPKEYYNSSSLYQYVSSKAIVWADPYGLEDIKIDGEIWQTPIVGDKKHVHVVPKEYRINPKLEDGGVHMHGPDGKKYFPAHGLIYDPRSDSWCRNRNFNKKMDRALLEKGLNRIGDPLQRPGSTKKKLTSRGAGLAAAFVAAILQAEQARGSTPQIDELKRELRKYLENLEAGNSANTGITTVGIADLVKDLFGRDDAALLIWGELQGYEGYWEEEKAMNGDQKECESLCEQEEEKPKPRTFIEKVHPE